MKIKNLKEKFTGLSPVITGYPDMGHENIPHVKGSRSVQDYVPMEHTFPELTSMLQERGYELLGSGSYGAAYVHEDQPGVVLKIYGDDLGWTKFWTIAKNSDNPHFPEVARLGRFKFGGFSFFGTWVERLEVGYGEKFMAMITDFSLYHQHPKIYPLAPEYIRKWPQLLAAFELISKPLHLKREYTYTTKLGSVKLETPRYASDIHEVNVLLRGSVPVFSDPLAS